jgi:hypothetical protein
MSDQHDYSQHYEQQAQAPYGSPGGPGAPPPNPPQPRAPYAPDRGKKSQFLAGLLSVFPGVGNIYVGFYTRGFVQVAVFIFCIVALSGGGNGGGIDVLFGLFMAFWWFFSLIDAVRCAGVYNQALLGGAGLPEMPANLSIPTEGSKTWGLVLMVVGVVFFLNTKFDFSMDWLEEWWPMFLVGFGAWLYWKARQNEKPQPTKGSSPGYEE